VANPRPLHPLSYFLETCKTCQLRECMCADSLSLLQQDEYRRTNFVSF
jgi:hypothetical protein